MSQTSQKLKDYFTPVGVGVLTALLTVASPITGKLGNTFDGTAQAQDVKPVKHAPVSVPMVDARGTSVDAVQFSSVAQSDNSIIVAFYGKDKDLFNDTKEAVREAIAAGKPVRGMIVGPPTDQSYAEVYAYGMLISKGELVSKHEVEDLISYGQQVLQHFSKLKAAPTAGR